MNTPRFARRRESNVRSFGVPPLPKAWPGGPFLISTRPPTTTQKWTAAAIVSAWLGAFLVTLAFRDSGLAHHGTFVPVANTIVCVNDLITAVLLYAQFSLTRNRALLVLANGYLFKALILIPHALSFPGAFAPNGLLGTQPQTAAWLYLAQHGAFLLGAIGYTVLSARHVDTAADDEEFVAPIARNVTLIVAAVLLVTCLVITKSSGLPPLMADSVRTSAGWRHVGGPLFATLAIASVIVFGRRSASMIDLWLKVAIWSWVLETLLLALLEARFSLVFYVARTMGVLSSSFVLLVFLSESLMLQRRLVLAIVAREREREGHRTAMEVTVGSLAHELRQPLASIRTNGFAGGLLLSSAPPEFAEVRAIFDEIGASVVRADAIIDSVRTMFANGRGDRAWIDANELAREAVEMMHIDLEANRIATQLELSPGLPPIAGHRCQLMQVLLNGLRNALESLAAVPDRPRQLRIRTARLDDRVSVVIEDNGRGLERAIRKRVFEPFYSTKPRGMGLGLSICQSIVGAHGGTVFLNAGPEHGAVFRVDLPALVAPAAPPRKTPVRQREVDSWQPRRRSLSLSAATEASGQSLAPRTIDRG